MTVKDGIFGLNKGVVVKTKRQRALFFTSSPGPGMFYEQFGQGCKKSPIARSCGGAHVFMDGGAAALKRLSPNLTS